MDLSPITSPEAVRKATDQEKMALPLVVAFQEPNITAFTKLRHSAIKHGENG